MNLIGLLGFTLFAVAAGSAVIFAAKTAVNTVDAITPYAANKKK